jgi:hypothetical protein
MRQATEDIAHKLEDSPVVGKRFGEPRYIAGYLEFTVAQHIDKAFDLGVARAHAIDQAPARFGEYRDVDILIWLAARLVNVYGESPDADYIRLAEKLSGQKVLTPLDLGDEGPSKEDYNFQPMEDLT